MNSEPASPMSQSSSVSLQNLNFPELKSIIQAQLTFQIHENVIHEMLSLASTWKLDIPTLPFVLRDIMVAMARQNIPHPNKKELVSAIVHVMILNNCCQEHFKREMIDSVNNMIDTYCALAKRNMEFGVPKKPVGNFHPAEDSQHNPNVQRVKQHLRFEVDSGVVAQLLACGDGYKLSLLTLPIVLRLVMKKMAELRQALNLVSEKIEEIVVQVIKVLIIDTFPEPAQQSSLVDLLHNLIKVYFCLSKNPSPFTVTMTAEGCCVLI